MFQELGASGIVLCYGPLALTIIGFIAFAYLTDNISTRTYLRNLDPRPEADQGKPQTYPVTQPTEVLTPAGARVVLVPGKAPAVRAAAAAAPVSSVAAAVAPVAESVAVAETDDLTRLEGIGPKLNAVLTAAGITTFAQIAAMTPEALRAVLDEAGIAAIHNPGSWPAQAILAAQGKWAELEALKAVLHRGK